MSFNYPRQVRFHETDGAGVVYFANVLTLCHEAYEASLAAAGIELSDFFSPEGMVVPIVHASIDFFRPMVCGDRINIILTPSPLKKAGQPLSRFEISYRLVTPFRSADKAGNSSDDTDGEVAVIAQAQTRHCCIDSETRHRQSLSSELAAWLTHWQIEP